MQYDEGIFKHVCEDDTCTLIVEFDDEPFCFTHSPDEGSSVAGYSARLRYFEKDLQALSPLKDYRNCGPDGDYCQRNQMNGETIYCQHHWLQVCDVVMDLSEGRVPDMYATRILASEFKPDNAHNFHAEPRCRPAYMVSLEHKTVAEGDASEHNFGEFWMRDSAPAQEIKRLIELHSEFRVVVEKHDCEHKETVNGQPRTT